jgi:hypothetical protein
MLGHASAAMTLDRYADLFDDDLETVATRLDESEKLLVLNTCCTNPKRVRGRRAWKRRSPRISGAVGGGRYWDRTSDPCRVKAVLSR